MADFLDISRAVRGSSRPIPVFQYQVRADKRTARHQRILQELAELGMDLARAAARRAQQDLDTGQAATPEPRPEAPVQAKTPLRKPADPTLLFTRLCSAVRQTVGT